MANDTTTHKKNTSLGDMCAKDGCACNNCCGGKRGNMNAAHGTGGALYFVGFIGSMVYWMQAAVGFGAVITGILKSMVWPAYIVYKLLESFYGVIN